MRLSEVLSSDLIFIARAGDCCAPHPRLLLTPTNAAPTAPPMGQCLGLTGLCSNTALLSPWPPCPEFSARIFLGPFTIYCATCPGVRPPHSREARVPYIPDTTIFLHTGSGLGTNHPWPAVCLAQSTVAVAAPSGVPAPNSSTFPPTLGTKAVLCGWTPKKPVNQGQDFWSGVLLLESLSLYLGNQACWRNPHKHTDHGH